MKKKMRFLSLLLAAALILGALPGTAFAVNAEMSCQPDEWMLGESNSGKAYAYNPATGEKVIKAWGYNEDGELVELDWVEYLQIKNSADSTSPEQDVSTNTQSVPYTADIATAYEYRETMTYMQHGPSHKVTIDIVGPSKIEYVSSVEVSNSFGGEINLTGTIKNMIQLGASFDWHETLSSSTSVGATFVVDPGETAYVRFTPYLDVTVGDLYYITVAAGHYNESNLGEVWGKSPRMLPNGFADGLLELVELY